MKKLSTLFAALAALTLSFLHPPAAAAGTITFNDLSPSAFVTSDIPTRISGSCASASVGSPAGPGEICTIVLTPPPGYGPPPGGGTSFQQTLNILEMPPGNINTISDTLTINPTLDANFNVLSFTLVFTSGDNLPSVGGNNIREDGTVQTASSITWQTPTGAILVSDAVQFQSTDSVPEPSTILMTLAGFGGLALMNRRRLARRRTQQM